MARDVEITLESLKANNFDAQLAQTAAEARQMMLEMIPSTATVGIGHSATLVQIGIIEDLTRRGNKVINPFTKQLSKGMSEDPAIKKLFLQMARMTLGTDLFLASSNAVTEDGKIVSIDRAGSRVAGMIFGAGKVILAVGRNKIVKDVDEAIHRIKNIIAPTHARQRGRRTPCAVTGKCNDCDNPNRLCNITLIIEKQPLNTDISIILIDEDLGLGWAPDWNGTRISKIRFNYAQNV